jgi:phosphatidylglycerophosphate synthase
MEENRRPIQSRDTAWAKKISQFLAKKNISPNQISVFSIFPALLMFVICLFYKTNIFLSIVFLGMIQLRLLANLFDGMVAIEGGKKSDVGAIYNEFPDRISDTLFICAFAMMANQLLLGVIASLLAVMTAYIRLLGGSLSLKQTFVGPMAKQHRMFVLNLSLVILILEQLLIGNNDIKLTITMALWLIIIGGVLTCAHRLNVITKQLKNKG